jgi:nicotinamide mononucleotide (NMN) deamidase PncC
MEHRRVNATHCKQRAVADGWSSPRKIPDKTSCFCSSGDFPDAAAIHVAKKQRHIANRRKRPAAGKLIYVTTPQTLIEQIHASGRQFVMAVTGGGSGAISGLLEVPGASASVLEAIVPYAASAMADWLGGTPDHYCSERTARAMAMAAFERARKLSDADPHTLRGIGATASLASNRPKRGPHRIHVAWQSADTTVVVSHTFSGEERVRRKKRWHGK